MAVISGSAPRAVTKELYAELAQIARKAKVPLILDAHDELLERALPARPMMIKPNMAEMQRLAQEVEARRPGIRFEWQKLIDLPAVSIPADTPIVRALGHWTQELTGQQPLVAGAGPANEGYLLIGAGIPTVCGFGPPGGNAHATDEYVEVAGLLKTAKIYAAAALDLLHLQAVDDRDQSE